MKIESLSNFKHIHFIGIGGIQMKALAALMHLEGYTVSGSDQNESAAIHALHEQGVTVFVGHDAAHITGDIDLVVYTAAVHPNNPEFTTAEARGIKMLDRAAFLGLLMKNYNNPVCVSGTHGKTTTTSMLAEILLEAGLNPTIMNGGNLPSIGGAMHRGGNEIFVAEACEYCDSFLRLFPHIAIILNVEYDHADYFSSLDAVRSSFRHFAELMPEDGALIINNAIDNIEEFTAGLKCRVYTFGEGGDYAASEVRFGEITSFELIHGGEALGRIDMHVPGYHNISNALAACAAADIVGASPQTMAAALAKFTGAERRFQFKGKYNGATIVDDYAHHPTEVKATLSSARHYPHNKLYCLFQPHTHSRTKEFLQDFAESFDDCDEALILDIYNPAGREEEDCKVHSRDLVELIMERDTNARYLSSFEEAENYLRTQLINSDLLITMGAGDVYRVGNALVSG